MQQEMEMILQRLRSLFVQQDNGMDKIDNYLDTCDENGCFADVDYTCESRSGWKTAQHLYRTAGLAQTYSIRRDEKYAKCADRCLRYWAKSDYRNSNWWWNDLGIPQLLARSAFLVENHLTEANRQYVISRLNREIDPKWTGANKIWFATNILYRGLLSGERELIARGKDRIQETICIAGRGEEGIQYDYSFAQHGAQLYNHGYGKAYIDNTTCWAYVLRDTAFSFDAEKIQLLTNLMLNGTLKMFRYNAMDFHARSRNIDRGHSMEDGRMSGYLPVLSMLLALNQNTPAEQPLRQAMAHITEQARMPALEGNTMFYCLDFMTHRKPGYYASVRMASRDVLGGDVCGGKAVNDENILDGFGAYGVCAYMTSGTEYYNIFPIWDWGLLPGATTPHIEMPLEIGGLHESTFVGGVSDGVSGVAAMDMHKSYTYNEQASFSGRKAVFLFNDCIVHLGNALCTDSAAVFNTSYNQCLLHGSVCCDGTPVEKNSRVETQADVLYHDRIAYYNLDRAKLTVDTTEKTGSWYKIHPATSTPQDTVTGHTFLLYRRQEKQNDSYAYAVVPGIDQQAALTYKPLEHIQFSASAAVQAVYHADEHKIGVVFYGPDSCALGNYTLQADTPCILLYTIDDNTLYLSDPVQSATSISVVLRCGTQETTVQVPMPQAAKDKGKTVAYRL